MGTGFAAFCILSSRFGSAGNIGETLFVVFAIASINWFGETTPFFKTMEGPRILLNQLKRSANGTGI